MDKYYKRDQSVLKYKVIEKIGEGRYGITYLAKNKKDKKVVIKQLKKDMLKDTKEKLFYEQEILKKLDHPAIPKFISKFKDKSRQGYILEYVEGRVFEDLVVKDEYVFTREEIYDVADQLLNIMHVLHEQHIVHRDIRLPNVILKENKEVALIDFGLARYMDHERYIKEVDYWYLGDFLIHLYYTFYEELGVEERPWYEELLLYPQEERFLKKLMGIWENYKSIEAIRADLNEIRLYHQLYNQQQKVGEMGVVSEVEIQKIHLKSFRANLYNLDPFRMIGLIDVNVKYTDRIERVTLAYYRSSGTNNGKIKGLWYPIIGIKMETGPFTEFTDYLNHALTQATQRGIAKKGWLAKSVFFNDPYVPKNRIRGFSNGPHYEPLLEIGKILTDLYERESYYEMVELDPEMLNQIVTSNRVYPGNKHTQRENYNQLMADIINGIK